MKLRNCLRANVFPYAVKRSLHNARYIMRMRPLPLLNHDYIHSRAILGELIRRFVEVRSRITSIWQLTDHVCKTRITSERLASNKHRVNTQLGIICDLRDQFVNGEPPLFETTIYFVRIIYYSSPVNGAHLLLIVSKVHYKCSLFNAFSFEEIPTKRTPPLYEAHFCKGFISNTETATFYIFPTLQHPMGLITSAN